MQTPANLISWILFLAFVVLMLALDLGSIQSEGACNGPGRVAGLDSAMGRVGGRICRAAVFPRALDDRQPSGRQTVNFRLNSSPDTCWKRR